MWWDKSKGNKRSILIKLYNTWYSQGDMIFANFDDSPEKIIELEQLLKDKYQGVPTLIMDLH